MGLGPSLPTSGPVTVRGCSALTAAQWTPQGLPVMAERTETLVEPQPGGTTARHNSRESPSHYCLWFSHF